jgi:ribosomal protein L30E
MSKPSINSGIVRPATSQVRNSTKKRPHSKYTGGTVSGRAETRATLRTGDVKSVTISQNINPKSGSGTVWADLSQ